MPSDITPTLVTNDYYNKKLEHEEFEILKKICNQIN